MFGKTFKFTADYFPPKVWRMSWRVCMLCYACYGPMYVCVYVLDFSLIGVVVVDSVVYVVGGASSISFLLLLLLLPSWSSTSAMPTRHHHRCQKNTRTHAHTQSFPTGEKPTPKRRILFCTSCCDSIHNIIFVRCASNCMCHLLFYSRPT